MTSCRCLRSSRHSRPCRLRSPASNRRCQPTSRHSPSSLQTRAHHRAAPSTNIRSRSRAPKPRVTRLQHALHATDLEPSAHREPTSRPAGERSGPRGRNRAAWTCCAVRGAVPAFGRAIRSTRRAPRAAASRPSAVRRGQRRERRAQQRRGAGRFDRLERAPDGASGVSLRKPEPAQGPKHLLAHCYCAGRRQVSVLGPVGA